MILGDIVIHEGCEYVLRGIDPSGVPERRADLEDPRTGRRLTVLFADVEPRDPGPSGLDTAA